MINSFKVKDIQQYHDGARVTYEVFVLLASDGSGSETTRRYLSSVLVPQGQDIDEVIHARIKERGWA